ncbi:FG-GAP repeat domain-containing protein [Tahibacter amnicola]|uniref:VCBS repeat-containing protein n=1 Tax=Tahibacter amnicola TaxID=2976241 RepID=A0ABY6BFJ3_9GAMM|nr:VCBS repeat-containing protein [Tahibacter amnicola]UXI68793.1 VCBS repeat-containing protein [Tahibacter amnicola]
MLHIPTSRIRPRRTGRAAGLAALVLSPLLSAADLPIDSGVPIGTNFGAVASLQLADLDGDGDQDVIGASSNTATIMGWYRNGLTYTARTISSMAAGVRSVAVGDIDRDGDLDLVGALNGAHQVIWWEQTSVGWSPHPIASVLDAWSVTLADVNADGTLDVIGTALNANRVFTFINRSNGTDWAEVATDTALPKASSVAAGDLDGDGDQDLVATAFGGTSVKWYENRAAGAGGAWVARTVTDDITAPLDARLADIDRDGDLDVTLGGGDGVYWYENEGNAHGWIAHQTGPALPNVLKTIPVDLDQDGDADLVSTSTSAHLLLWRENIDGRGTQWTERRLDVGLFQANAVVAGDVDRDGDLDVVAGGTEGDVGLYRNWRLHRKFFFHSSQQRDIQVPMHAQRARLADLDRDGDLDGIGIAYANQPGPAGMLVRWINDGTGQFSAPLNFGAGQHADLALADVNRDGVVDAVAAGAELAWYGWHTGTWTRYGIAKTPEMSHAIGVAAADFNRDGRTDVAIADDVEGAVYAWINVDGGNTWTRQVVATGITGVNGIASGDFDRDGRTDLGTISTDGTVRWYRNGSAGWIATLATSGIEQPTGIAARDIDSDGDLDLLVSQSAGTTLVKNNANATSWTPRIGLRDPGDYGYTAISAADFDTDGDADLAVSAADMGMLFWGENDDSVYLTGWVGFDTLPGAVDLDSGDIDGDGDPDLIGAGRKITPASGVRWWRNFGGQYELLASNTPSGTVPAGRASVLMAATIWHQGNQDDLDLKIARLNLYFESAPGVPLTSAEANALIQRVHVYTDNGNGVLDPMDTVAATVEDLSLSDGVLAIDDSTAQSLFQVSTFSQQRYFIVPTYVANPPALPARFRATFLGVTDGAGRPASLVRDTYGVALSNSATSNGATGFLVVDADTFFRDGFEPRQSSTTDFTP